MKTLIKALHFAAILLSGWLVMRSMSHLIRISEKRLRRFLLFFGCSILASMIIFIGDPFNILATTPVFWQSSCLHVKAPSGSELPSR